jgi:hypothetical protein
MRLESRSTAVSAYGRLLVYAALRSPKLSPSSLKLACSNMRLESRGADVRVPIQGHL